MDNKGSTQMYVVIITIIVLLVTAVAIIYFLKTGALPFVDLIIDTGQQYNETELPKAIGRVVGII